MNLYDILVYNAIQVPVQLLLGEMIFLFDRERREHFPARLLGGLLMFFAACALWERIFTPLGTGNLFFYVVIYLGYTAFSGLWIYFCFDVSIQEVLFIVAGGYATQHMIFSIDRILLYCIHVPYATNGDMLHLLLNRYLLFLVGSLLVYVAIVRNHRGKSGFTRGDIRLAFLALLLMFIAVGISVYWSYPVEYTDTFIGGIICPLYSFLCCALVLAMDYFVLRDNRMKQEREMMEQLLQMANNQQKSSREAIDIINIKCHDLKHQIRALAQMEDPETRSQYLQEVQEAVSIYDATYHTGCKPLDYVLREKTLMFNEHHVEFSCIIEGETLNFMSSADVYALMGNALDNALERVLQEAIPERVISLSIKHKGEMLLIHLENRCSRTVEFREGLPVTDKADKNQHGFGVRSIRYIVEKYHGEVFMKNADGKFMLDILFATEPEQK